MLRPTPTPELMRREMRRRVCPYCHWRPPHSESLGPDVARPCESGCSLFANLPRIQKAVALIDPMLRSRRDLLQRRIADICGDGTGTRDTPRGFGAPAPGPAGVCDPLSRYRDTVTDAVLDLMGEA